MATKIEEAATILMMIGAIIVSFVLLIAINHVPTLPSVSVESMSVTVVNIVSDTQVKANLEVVFAPVENKNMHNTVIYKHINALAFRSSKLGTDHKNFRPIYSDKKLIENVTAVSFEQQELDKTRVSVRMSGVTVDLDEYEQYIYGRYGVSYINFELMGSLEMKEGKWMKRTSNMIAECQVLKVVFPLYQWNQTKRLDFQPPIACYVYGDWGKTRY